MVSQGPARGEQFSLAGFEAPKASDRLFFAVVPDPPAAARIEALAQVLRHTLGLRGRPRPTAHFHVTLHHLGDYAGVPPAIVDSAIAAAATVTLDAFDVLLDRVGSFAGHRTGLPFVLRGSNGVNGLCRLHELLAARLAASAPRLPTERAFVPHITLLYDNQRVPEQEVEPVRWTVREFVLIHSLLGRTEYRILGRWTLGRE